MLLKRCVTVLILGALFAYPAVGSSQQGDGSSPLDSQVSEPKPSSSHSIEDLNLLGADTTMPAFNDTMAGDNSSFRRATYRRGFIFRVNGLAMYVQNMLNNPGSSTEEVYVGERPYGKTGSGPLLVWDMRQLHLKDAQLNVGSALLWVRWNPAGPKAAALSDLNIYKSFFNDRLEMKVGYLRNDFEFLGMQVGGSISSGAQGVYAVLPFEAGLSHFPIVTPSLNFKFNNPSGIYEKIAFQRSVDPGGGSSAIGRDAIGLRFIPHGDKLLTVFEAGYKHDADDKAPDTWIRGGTMYNTTGYSNSQTGGTSSGNYCTYLLADHQFLQTGGGDPKHGFYAGASAMVAPADLNIYTQYYELRLYDKAPFRSRPDDMATIVSSRSIYSRDTIRNLLAEGKTVWRSSNSVTGSYSVHVARGVYTSVGVCYVTGPAVTPHVSNALSLSVQTSLFF